MACGHGLSDFAVDPDRVKYTFKYFEGIYFTSSLFEFLSWGEIGKIFQE